MLMSNVAFTGQSFHQHPSLLDCLLPLVSRNYSAYVTRCAFARKIRLVHNDSRYIQVKFMPLSSNTRYYKSYPAHRLIRSRIIESAAYCNQILQVLLQLNWAQKNVDYLNHSVIVITFMLAQSNPVKQWRHCI
jgi:hypothetical protein